jgi:hypothetical protein
MRVMSFIGSRDLGVVSPSIVQLFRKAAEVSVRSGYTLATGAAPGFDQLAAETALAAGGHVLLKLPWAGYECAWITHMRDAYPAKIGIEVYAPFIHVEWTESVRIYHPAVSSLSQGAIALHARNYGIVAPATTVIAVPNPFKPGGGGTGQGIRIAEALRIRCFNLSNPEHAADVEARLCRF